MSGEACGVLAASGDGAGQILARALAEQTLAMLRTLPDLRRRTAGLTCAATLAALCQQIAAAERGGRAGAASS
jgi:hypothetical protein